MNGDKSDARPAPTFRCENCGVTWTLERYDEAFKDVCPRCGQPAASETKARTVTR